jgi:tetratricopeptide (TPR) repeat protein
VDFNTYLNQAWDDHANSASVVAENFSQGLSLSQNADHLAQLARLSTHVFGEHLGRWDDGLEFLNQIKKNPHYLQESAAQQMKIYEYSLALSGQQGPDLSSLTPSELIRVLSLSASAISEQGQPAKAKEHFLHALEVAQLGLDAKDPANRALAITGNNLSASLEKKEIRSPEETELMVLSAQIGLQFWAIAGTWKEIERAEYRLSQSYLQAGQFEKSLQHAKSCLEICEQNSAPPLEVFFGYEALALVEKARGQKAASDGAVAQMKVLYEIMPEDEKPWCRPALEKI